MNANFGQRREIYLFRASRQSSGANPTYTTGTVESSSRVKQPEPKTDHILPSSAKIKDGGIIPPLPHKSSRRGA
jgi:hypothetical protein